jgi:hypothetical protein
MGHETANGVDMEELIDGLALLFGQRPATANLQRLASSAKVAILTGP